MKQEIMDLWKVCFNDTEEFIRFYFEKKYREENVLVARNHTGAVIAALQTPLYSMTYANTEIPVGYILGACTHPLERGRGIMTGLLKEAFSMLRKRKIPMSVLIPADEWLFDYYGKMGYATVFDYTLEHYICPEKPLTNEFRVEVIRDEALLDRSLYVYLRKMMRQRSCCVQHDQEDFKTIVGDLRLAEGFLVVVYCKMEIVGMAFAAPNGNHVLIQDWVYNSDEVKQRILWEVMINLDMAEIYCRALPAGRNEMHRGMARVLDVEYLMQLYAKNHPEQNINLKITDDLIPENTGIYLVCDGGVCRHHDESIPVDATLNERELVQLLLGYHPERYPKLMGMFIKSTPFISLMLD